MAKDKYTATWVSHSSMGDFLKCPRAYYLHNMYKDPKTGRKINVASPALSLGVAVHEVVEGLGKYKAEERFKRSLVDDLALAWKKVSGKKGGFKTAEEEADARARAEAMVKRVAEHPEPLLKKTVKVKEGDNGMPPNFYLSEEDNIILCGKIDWLIWNPEDDSVHILDFKTGKYSEDGESLQLPIYQLLLDKLQKRKVNGASYWYLDRDDVPVKVELPGVEESYEKVIKVAKEVAAARARSATLGPSGPKEVFICPAVASGKGPDCFACRPFEKILRGEAEYIGVGEYKQDIYMV